MKTVLSVLVLITALAGASAVPSGNSAAELVFEDILQGDITGRSVMVLDEMVTRGTVMGSWRYEVTVPLDGYLVLIDDMAYANWEHPCRWVFVSPEGDMEIVRMNTPPDALERMKVTHTCLPEETGSRGQYEDFIEWFEPNVQSTPAQAEHMYALIISGGASQGSNHIRYYGDVQFIYNVLAHDYLLPDDHIIVCFADGLNPAPDQSGGLNSNPDFDDDGDSDIIYDATSTGVANGFADIASMCGNDDHLFIYTTDHGGSGKFMNSPPEVYLNLWGGSLDDDAYQTTVSGLSYASCHAVMEQCFSGGFLEEHMAGTTGKPSSFASAANGYESSWAGATYPEYDEYVYYWTGAMHGSTPPASSVPGGALPGDPDMNGDGYVSFWEAFDRAKAWDTYAQSGQEHPQWDDDPDSCGDMYFLGGLIQTGIGDEGDPFQPATGGLAVSGNPLSSVSTVSFSINTPGDASVLVYDMSGHVVSELVSQELAAGEHTVSWNTGSMASGVYIIRFRAADFAETLRVVKF